MLGKCTPTFYTNPAPSKAGTKHLNILREPVEEKLLPRLIVPEPANSARGQVYRERFHNRDVVRRGRNRSYRPRASPGAGTSIRGSSPAGDGRDPLICPPGPNHKDRKRVE